MCGMDWVCMCWCVCVKSSLWSHFSFCTFPWHAFWAVQKQPFHLTTMQCFLTHSRNKHLHPTSATAPCCC